MNKKLLSALLVAIISLSIFGISSASAQVLPLNCISAVPANGATNVALTAPLTVSFNRPIQVPNVGSVPTGIILSYYAGGMVQSQAITVEMLKGGDPNTVAIIPANVLLPNTQYTLTIQKNGILDVNNEQLPAPCVYKFATAKCAAPSDVKYTGAMRVPGYMSYLMWSFQNDGACDVWVGPWGRVYTADGKIDQVVTSNWYFPVDMGQQATVTTMDLGWGKVKPMSATTFVTPGVMHTEDRYVVTWAKVWDDFSGQFMPQIGPKVATI
jgi:hypothetical protein